MKNFTITAFSKNGDKLLDESFNASNDEEAKKTGRIKLEEAGYSDHTHRCVSEDARLLLFHR